MCGHLSRPSILVNMCGHLNKPSIQVMWPPQQTFHTGHVATSASLPYRSVCVATSTNLSYRSCGHLNKHSIQVMWPPQQAFHTGHVATSTSIPYRSCGHLNKHSIQVSMCVCGLVKLSWSFVQPFRHLVVCGERMAGTAIPGGGGRRDYISRYAVTRMISALRWALMRAILVFHSL